MMKRRALGKGLASLIPEVPPSSAVPAVTATEGLRYLDPGAIVPNRNQPREAFDDAELETLADSIRRDGLLQPILVRPLDGGYEIVAGERRWRASILAGLGRIPTIVQNVTEDRALELALVENLLRRDLDPIEEARAFKAMTERFGLTQDQIAQRTGRSRPSVANAVRLLRLPVDVQTLLRNGEISRGHARALLVLDDESEIRALAQRLRAESMSVRSAEQTVKPARTKAGSDGAGQDPNVRSAQERLQSRLGTQVRIRCSAAGKGRIEIHFASHEELSRLFDGLLAAVL